MTQRAAWFSGTVVRGDGRGRKLGFPTANLRLDNDAQRPADGVYAAWVKLGKETRRGAVHVGPRPTFAGAAPTVEVHLLDFPDRDLYGERLSFQPVERLRGIIKFDSAEELSVALKEDCEKTAARLA
jgi:riboflavin kinase / FMN adenylyltransferase